MKLMFVPFFLLKKNRWKTRRATARVISSWKRMTIVQKILRYANSLLWIKENTNRWVRRDKREFLNTHTTMLWKTTANELVRSVVRILQFYVLKVTTITFLAKGRTGQITNMSNCVIPEWVHLSDFWGLLTLFYRVWLLYVGISWC